MIQLFNLWQINIFIIIKFIIIKFVSSLYSSPYILMTKRFYNNVAILLIKNSFKWKWGMAHRPVAYLFVYL